MAWRQEKINSLIRELASKFIQVNAKIKDGLITITKTEISSNLKNVKIYLTVFPEKKEKEALRILRSVYYDWQKYLASKFKARFLPHSEFLIDEGEKNRQRIEELLK